MAKSIDVVLKLNDKFSGGMGKGMKGVKVGMAAVGAAAVATGAAIWKLTNEISAYNDNLGKASVKAGITVEELSQLKHAFELSGGASNSAGIAMTTFATKIGRAQDGFGTASKAIRTLGIDLKNADGSMKSQSQLLDEVADGMAKMEDGANKTLVATQLFASESKTMINATKDGAAGLRAMKEEADAMGLTVTSNTAAVSAAFTDMKNRLTKQAFGSLKQFAEQILPSMTAAVEMLKDAFGSLGGESSSDLKKVGDAINQWLLPVLNKAIYYGKVVFATFKLVGSYFKGGFTFAFSTAKLAVMTLVNALKQAWDQAKVLGQAIKLATQGEFKAAVSKAKELGDVADKYNQKQKEMNSQWVANNLAAAKDSSEAMDVYLNSIREASNAQQDAIVKANQTVAGLKTAELNTSAGGIGDTDADDVGGKKGGVKTAVDPRIAREQAIYAELAEARKRHQETMMSADEIELARMNAKYQALIKQAGDNEELIHEIKLAKATEYTDFQRRQTEERMRLSDMEADKAIESANRAREAQTDAFIGLGRAYGNYLVDSEKDEKKRAQKAKAVAVANATIDTFQMVAKTMTQYPYPFNIGIGAAALGAGMLNVSAIKNQKFAYGGIVQGTETRGDKIPIRANAKEAILTTGDQKELLDIARGKRNAATTNGISYSPNLTITGDNDAPVVRRLLAENMQEFKSFIHTTMREDSNVPRFR